MAKVEIQATAVLFDGQEQDEIEAEIIDKAKTEILSRMSEDLTKQLRREVETTLKAQATEILREVIQKSLDEGIEETNTWGERTGKKTTLRAIVMDQLKAFMLTGKDYNGRATGKIETLIADCVQQFIAKELVDELAGVKTKLKAALTTAVLGNMQEQVSKVIKGY